MDEDGLQKRLVSGDDLALAEIYDRFGGLVFGLALRITRDRTLAEDVTQETFLTLWESAETFDPARGSLRAWLCMVAHRRAVDMIRKNESYKRRARRSAEDVAIDLTANSAEQEAISADDHTNLRIALTTLPEEQRSALELAYFDGLTFREVAKVLRIPEGTAKSRIRLAIQRLAESLHERNQIQLGGVQS